MREISRPLRSRAGALPPHEGIMKRNKLSGLLIGGFALLVACVFHTSSAVGDECPFPMFAATRAYPIGGVGFSVAVGDFNKDGKPDVAVVVGSTTNTVQIFLGNGDGTLQPPINYTPTTFPQSIVAIDVNRDGNLDLVIGVGTQMWVLLGNGNGTFKPAIPVTSAGSVSFALGYFDSDANPDLASYGSISVRVQKGVGDGTFLPGTDYPISFPVQESMASIAVGDFNGDGKSDIVVGTMGQTNGHLAVLFGNGDGTFSGPKTNLTALTPSTLAVGDFNSDGKRDVAAGDYDTGTVTIFLGNGDGTFVSGAVYFVGTNLTSITVADFNSDGTNDLVVTTLSRVTILLGVGNGTFRQTATFGGLWEAAAVGDFNGDGKLDLVSDVQAASAKIGITLGNGDGTFKAAVPYKVGGNPQSVATGDLNGDGHLDLVVANFDSNTVSVLLNNGDGTYQPASNYPTPTGPQAVAIGDLNGDGTNDIVVSTLNTTNAFSVLLNKGNGTFKPAINFGSFGGAPIAVGDFNGDHKLDILANSLLAGFQVQLGNGKGGFASAPAVPGVNAYGYAPGLLVVGHFNADTNLDFALGVDGESKVTVGLGKGDGTFQVVNTSYAGTNCQGIAAGDFNGDGKLDLAVADGGTSDVGQGAVFILLGNGDGTFKLGAQYPQGAHAAFVACADFNGDGKLDLAVRYIEGFGMGVMLGNGDGTFQPAVDFGSMNDALFAGVAVGDLNGDGKPDAAVLDLPGEVAVLLNTCTAATPVGPQLSLSQTISSGVISWPVSLVYSLESNTNLASTNWLKATQPLSTNNGTVQVTVPFNRQAQFFRLHKQ